MKCPSCAARPTLLLDASPSEPRLHYCPKCTGRWIRAADYWSWQARAGLSRPDRNAAPTPVSGDVERTPLRFCPDDGYLLARFVVGGPHAFSIDQCRSCAGAWFDAGEWEALRDGGLATQLHLVLSDEWQDELRKAQRESNEREQWLRQLGAGDLKRIAEVKEWLDNHPKRSELYAYLRFHERAV